MQAAGFFLLRYLLICCAVAGAFYSFLLARASWLFQQDTPSSVAAAVALVPGNSAYLLRLATLQPGGNTALLHRAVLANPFEFQSWIQLGLISEFQNHDAGQAERYYLEAARVNHMYLPKWTLTNFYFRQDRPVDFFRWAKESLAITPYSPDPIFAQLWMATHDEARIAAAIPDRGRTLLPYAWFLSTNGKNEGIPEIVTRLVQTVGKTNPSAWGRDDLLAAIQDRMLASGDGDDALRVWSTLCRAGWLRQAIPTGSQPIWNEEFKMPLYPHGFGWIPVSTAGVRADPNEAAGSIAFYLSGAEPDRCTLMRKYLTVEPGRSYKLAWRLQFHGIESPSGFTWKLRSQSDTEAQEQSGDLFSSVDWTFTVPPKAGLCVLELDYTRPPGHSRIRGQFSLREVSARMQ